jgi:hypothetical protein
MLSAEGQIAVLRARANELNGYLRSLPVWHPDRPGVERDALIAKTVLRLARKTKPWRPEPPSQ